MANKDVYVCDNCGWETVGWVGQCGDCGEWGKLVPVAQSSKQTTGKLSQKKKDKANKGKEVRGNLKIKPIQEVDLTKEERISSEFVEFDSVLGGGFVKSSIVLLAGEPGVGKSTLTLATALRKAKKLQDSQKKVIYISGEESMSQIAKRFNRLTEDEKPEHDNLILIESRDIDEIINSLSKVQHPALVVWDSLQAFFSQDSNGVPGGIAQSRYVANKIIDFSRETQATSIIIGQVTKEGTAAGPKLIEHMVDAVFYIEAIDNRPIRLLRAYKNRFGSTMEVGMFKMHEHGLSDIKSTKGLFSLNRKSKPGSVIGCILEGNRVIEVGVQGLVVPTVYGMPRRKSQGISKKKLEIIVAILTKSLGLKLGDKDIFVNIAGGLKIKEPSIDLAIATAIISSLKDITIDGGKLFCGELTLSGDILEPLRLEKRFSIIKRRGYDKLISNTNNDKISGDKKFVNFEELKNLARFLGA
jgi:DNA repair protein RadA/Sms